MLRYLATANGNSKKLLYLICFSIFLVKILDREKQVSGLHYNM